MTNEQFEIIKAALAAILKSRSVMNGDYSEHDANIALKMIEKYDAQREREPDEQR